MSAVWNRRTLVAFATTCSIVRKFAAGKSPSSPFSSLRTADAIASGLESVDQPFGWQFELQVDRYAKASADLVMLRPRVLGEWSSGLLERDEPRRHPIEFDGPRLMSDDVEITLPAGWVIDELPPSTNSVYPFATYRSRTETKGAVLHYTRTLEIRQLSVPVSAADQLREFYRAIAEDERRVAMLKRRSP